MADFRVTNTSDNGTDSLRQAILAANSTSEDDVIELAEGTYKLSIEGTDDNSATGDLDIVSNSGTLTIRGLGAGATIDANQIDRVFHVFPNATLILENITVTGGKALDGGGIGNNGGLLVLTNSTVSGNSTDAEGGGIYNTPEGEVELIDSIVSNNTAGGNGGGIFNDSKIGFPSVSNFNPPDILGKITLTGSAISGNTTEGEGGGIFTNEGLITVNDSAISNNIAASNGGGIAAKQLAESTLSTNKVTDIIFNNSSISKNSAGGRGGGISVYGKNATEEENQITLNSSTISENNSVSNGGGISISGFVATLTNTTVSNNIVSNGNGGGISIGNSIPIEIAKATILDSNISNNQASEKGGGIFNASQAIVARSNISGNTAGTNGGGIFTTGNPSITDANINVVETTIDLNVANNDGGGFFNDGSSATLFVNTISNNKAGNDGGGIVSSFEATNNVQNTTISGNTANSYGGGIFNQSTLGAVEPGGDVIAATLGGTTNLQNSTVTENIADFNNDGVGNGGGISNLRIRDGIIIGSPGFFNAQNSIIAGNIDTGSVDNHPDISGLVTGDGNNLVSNLDGKEGSIGTGSDIVTTNLGLTPLQDNGGNTFTHALLEDSIAVNAGNNNLIFSDRFDVNTNQNTEESFPFDQRGQSRIAGGTVDIGAFELQDGEIPEPGDPDNPELIVQEADFLQDPSQYMGLIRDFDGNDLGASDSWKSIGSIDVQGDGDEEHVFVNPVNGRWATVGVDITGVIDFSNHGQGGDTRIVGIYIDPLVEAGIVEKNSDFDSQRRFQNDLFIDNLTLIEGSGFDYDSDGLQEIYFRVNDGTAVLHALMHADGNIQYANYQSESDLEQFMTENSIDSSIWDDWF